MRLQTWHAALVIAVFGLIAFGTKQAVGYYNQKQIEKRNYKIVSFCEDYRWRDDWAKNHASEFDGEMNFQCSDYLYLKPKVKKSNSGICHTERSSYYARTKEYKIFSSLEDCLKSGGRRVRS